MKSSLALFATLLALALVDLALATRGGRGRGAQCPSTEGMMGVCVEACATDADCQADHKCCSNGCGHACMAPEPRGRNPCKYTKGTWGTCDETSNTMTRTDSLRRGGATCEPTKTTTRPCRDPCKYRKDAWSECDPVTNMKSRTLTLKKGDATACEATKTEERTCNAGNSDKQKPTKKNKRRNKDKTFRCHYSLTEMTKCDDVTNSRTMTLTLKKGLPLICEQSKTVSKPCKNREADNDCTYGEPEVSDCVDNEKTITRTLVSGDAATCEATKSKTKRCGGGGGGGRRGNGRAGGKKNRRRQRQQEETE